MILHHSVDDELLPKGRLTMPAFMNLVLTNLRKDRPKVPESLGFTIRTERNVSRHLSTSTHATIYFRTRGCRFSNFACTMCDYWISDEVSADQMVSSVSEALKTLDFMPHEMLFNVSGSFFDDLEVLPVARKKIFELLSQYKETKFIFEAHAHDITKEKIVECKAILRDNPISVEMGLESANPWVLRYCINKMLDLNRLTKALSIFRDNEVRSIVNIMVGTPFLSTREMIADTISTVNWAFDQGIDKCVLFPMNTKPWTLVFWMEEHGLYERLSLWALVEVLARLSPELLPRVGIAWHRTRPQLHPKYSTENRGPITCQHCYDRVMDLLDAYVLSTDRQDIVRQLVEFQCSCKDTWKETLRSKPASSLVDRLKESYLTLGKDILGAVWWDEHGESVLSNIAEPDLGWFRLEDKEPVVGGVPL